MSAEEMLALNSRVSKATFISVNLFSVSEAEVQSSGRHHCVGICLKKLHGPSICLQCVNSLDSSAMIKSAKRKKILSHSLCIQGHCQGALVLLNVLL
eukprot:1159937-Pelagomonas_calceolata.AAC.1